MEAPASAIAPKPRARKDHLGALAHLLSRLTAADEVVPQIPQLFVDELEAARCELWLSEGAAGSARLAHAAGIEEMAVADHLPLGVGPIGSVLQNRQPLTNTELQRLGGPWKEYAKRHKVSHLSVFPLMEGRQAACACAVYSRAAAGPEMLRWWGLCAQMGSLAAGKELAVQRDLKSITQLSLLFEATKLLQSTLDLSELLELILKIAKTECRADRGTVFLVDNKRQQLWSIVAFGLEHEEIRLPFGRGVAGRVASTGEVLNVEDAYSLEFFEPSFDQKFQYKTRSLLCLPIRHVTGEVVGVIQLLNKITGRFTRDDEDFLQKLSGHMAMALENARLHKEALEKQRMERELEMARGIQRGLLPEEPPVVPGYELAVANKPCYEVGGDYYDFLSLGPQTLLLVIADVEGKGVSSALVMSNLQATLRALVTHLHSLEVLALSLNEMIYNDTRSRKFLSIFLGLLDTRKSGLHYINAGHVPPLLVSGETGQYKLLHEGGTVVGLFPEAEYARGSVRLSPGDVLVCCTDGVTEPCDERDEEYGTERMADCVARHRHKSAQHIVQAVLDDVTAFAINGKHLDDQVLMVLKVTQTGGLEAATSSSRQSSSDNPN